MVQRENLELITTNMGFFYILLSDNCVEAMIC